METSYIPLENVTFRSALLVAGMHVKYLERRAGFDIALHEATGMVVIRRDADKATAYFVGASFLESAISTDETPSGVVHEPLPPPPNPKPPENREMFARVARDPADKEEIDADIQSLIDGTLNPAPKARRKK